MSAGVVVGLVAAAFGLIGLTYLVDRLIRPRQLQIDLWLREVGAPMPALEGDVARALELATADTSLQAESFNRPVGRDDQAFYGFSAPLGTETEGVRAALEAAFPGRIQSWEAKEQPQVLLVFFALEPG